MKKWSKLHNKTKINKQIPEKSGKTGHNQETQNTSHKKHLYNMYITIYPGTNKIEIFGNNRVTVKKDILMIISLSTNMRKIVSNKET